MSDTPANMGETVITSHGTGSFEPEGDEWRGICLTLDCTWKGDLHADKWAAHADSVEHGKTHADDEGE